MRKKELSTVKRKVFDCVPAIRNRFVSMVTKRCFKSVSTEEKKMFNGKEITSFKDVFRFQR